MKEKTVLISRTSEIFSAFLLAAGLVVIQVLTGGTRLLFSLPTYGVLGVIGLLSIFCLRRGKPEPDQICFASAALFFGYILARAFFSPVIYLARVDTYSVLAGLIVYFFVANLFTDPKRRMLLLCFLMTAAMVHVFIGAIQFRSGNNFMLISFLKRYDYGRRASGFYVCPNHLAGLLEVLGVFGLSIVCWSRWPAWAKLLIAYAAGMCYVGLILTGSRGGYLSTVVSLLVFGTLGLMILYRASRSLFWKIGGLGIIIAAVIGISAVTFVQKSDFLAFRAHNALSTAPLRLDLWHAAIEEWKAQPLIGTGSGTYLYYGRMFRTDRMQYDPVRAHNDYLDLLGEYGLVGGACFLVFLALHLRRGWKSFQRIGPKRVAVSSRLLSNGMALQVGAIAAVSAYMVHSIVDFNLHIPANILLLAFVFGIVANAGTQHGPELPPARGPLIRWRLAMPAIGLVLAVQSARLWSGEYFAERARTAVRDSHPKEAIAFAQRGLASEQHNPSLYEHLGTALTYQGNLTSDPLQRTSLFEAAVDAFQKARALAPQDKFLVVKLGFMYDTLGRFNEAEWMFDEALVLDPRSISTKEFYEEHLNQWREANGASPQSQ